MKYIKKILDLISDDDKKYVPIKLSIVKPKIIDIIYFMMTHNYEDYNEEHKFILRNVDIWIFLYKKPDIYDKIKIIVKTYDVNQLGNEHRKIVGRIFH